MNRRTLAVAPSLITVAFIVAACAASTGPLSSVGSSHSSPDTPAVPSSSPEPTDLAAIVLPPDEPPDGMTLSDEGRGRPVLQQLPLFPETADQLETTPGFVDGRWSRFAGAASDFDASRGFILTWVVEYDSEANAESALAILRNELESDDHYGWGTGEDAGLGDEGTCLDGENPQMGGLQETLCVWRRAQLVMVVGGGTFNETPVQTDAAAMDARAAEVLP